jgi:hypothetical protein
MLQHILTDKECDFLIELLAAESVKLMRETRHTDTQLMRHDLQERIRTADRLAERFREFKGGLLTP